MGGRFSVKAIFRASVQQFLRPVRHMQDRLRRFTGTANGHMRLLSRIGSVMRAGMVAALVAIVAAAAGAARALQEVIQVGMEFDTATAAAGALFGNIRRGTEDFAALEAAAMRVGATTEFTATQASQGLGFLAMAGFTAEQSMSSLAGVVDLATAAQLELGEATDIASDILGNQGLMTDDADQLAINIERVNDVLARTSTTANTNVREMFEAFRTGGATAHASGASIETFSALLGQLAGAGVKGAEAGTAVRTMFLRLVNPSREARGALRRLGVDVADADGNMRDMIDIIGDLQGGLAGRGTADRGRLLAQLFGARGVTSANILLAAGSDTLREYRSTLEDAGGAASEMAATMRDTAGGDLASMNSAIEGFKLQLWSAIRGPVREIVQGMTEWVRANQGWITSGFQDAMTWLVDNLPTIAVWTRRLAITFGILSLALIPITITLLAIMAAVLLVPAIIAGVVLAIVALVDWLSDTLPAAIEEVGAFFSSMWESVSETMTAAFEFVVGLFVLLGRVVGPYLWPVFDVFARGAAWVRDRWRPIGAWFADLWAGVSSAFDRTWNAIATRAASFRQTLQSIWKPVGAFFSSLWGGITSSFTSTFSAVLGQIGAVVAAVRGEGRAEIDGVGGDVRGAPSAQVVSPQERTARTISETTNTTNAEVTVRAGEGTTAEVTRRPRGNGVGLNVQPSGAL